MHSHLLATLLRLFLFVFLYCAASPLWSQFNPPLIFDAGFTAHMLVEGDFNNDGLIDIATANNTGDDISILLGVRVDSFAAEVLYSAGNGPTGIAKGDLNGDMILDLVVTNNLDDDFSIFIGNGDGTFANAYESSVGNSPRGISIADFNGDGKDDVAVANDLDDDISIRLGNGNGTFGAKVDYVAGDRPHGLLTGLIDADAFMDIITINQNDDEIAVLRGNGNGTFQSPVTFAVGNSPNYGCLGDFNGDNLIDLAVCNRVGFDSVSILLGDAVLMFLPAQNFYAGDAPFDVATGDFNLDSIPDLAITNPDIDSITILMGNGDGTFSWQTQLLSGNSPNGIIALDVDDDSDIDLINVNFLSGGSTHLILNNFCFGLSLDQTDVSLVGGNDGTATAIISAGYTPFSYLWDDPGTQTDSIAIGLVAGDYSVTVTDSIGCEVSRTTTISDPICSLSLNEETNLITSLGGNDGEAVVTPIGGTPPFTFLWDDPGAQTDSIADGLAFGFYEVVVTDSIGCMDTANFSMLEMPCLSDDKYYSGTGTSDIDLAYIDGDSILDLVTLYSVAFSNDMVNVSLGNGDGSFTYHSSFNIASGSQQPVNIEINDYNGDSINDIVCAIPDGTNGIAVTFGNGDGTFQAINTYFVGSRPWDMVTEDFDGDGDNDLLVILDQAADVRYMRNNGSGVFSSSTSYSIGPNPRDIKEGDFNGDGQMDLATTNKNGWSVSILIRNGASFLPRVNYAIGDDAYEATVNDFNNDGFLDIAAANWGTDNMSVLIGNGDGTFQNSVNYPTGQKPLDIESYDMNGDGFMDIAVPNSIDSTILFFLGDGSGTFDATATYHFPVQTRVSVTGDLENDSDVDMVLCLQGLDSVAVIKNCIQENCLYIVVDSTAISDYGENNGVAGIMVLGEHGPFTIEWNDPLSQNTLLADSLAPGTYSVLVTDTNNCQDSIEIVIIEGLCTPETTLLNDTICSGDSVLFAGDFLLLPGTYEDSLMAVSGCDSIVTLELIVNSSASTTDVISACNSYTWIDGMTYTASISTATHLLTTNAGCDSLVILDLTINYASSGTEFITACDSYTWIDGMTYTSNTSATHILNTTSGCDSLVTLDLTMNYSSIGTDVITACDSYTWIDGNTYSASNTSATHTLNNAAGCDSIVTLDLAINYSSSGTDVITACNNYLWVDGITYSASNNSATHLLNTAAGCDSMVTLDLTVNYTSTATDFITACDSYTWIDGITYTASNTSATHILNTVAGCDSIVSLDLTINYSSTGTDVITACDSYTWIDGITYTSSNTTATHILNNAAGCDSVVTLDLSLNYATSGTDVQQACMSFSWIDGNTYTSNNTTATHLLNTVAGCDSLVTLNLTIAPSLSSTDIQMACDSFSWIDGNTYTSDNSTATQLLISSEGCDSLVTLDLTVNYSSSGMDVITACDSYTWIDGMTYTSNNTTATHILNTTAGCDSIVTLDLTINYSSSGMEFVTACDSYTWIDGITYSSNTIATHILNTTSGCDSIVTLDLTMSYSSSATDVITACDSYTWIDGMTYTSSNTSATHILNTASGCDSIVTLELTINYASTGIEFITACDSYTWIDGMTYTASNTTPTHILNSSTGCDSVVTLDLTISYSSSATEIITACDSYTWIDGNTYTSNNNSATHILNTATGCDSIITLDLTVNHSSTATDVITACDSYTWIDGNTYTSNNNSATHILNTAAGCDSLVTLDLTIDTINTAVIHTGDMLTSEQEGATYQWWTCGNIVGPIDGETGQSFTPTSTGFYYVELSMGACMDTSECILLEVLGLDTREHGISLYPNPTSGKLSLELSKVYPSIEVLVFNSLGQEVSRQLFRNGQSHELHIDGSAGVYFVRILLENEAFNFKVRKE